MAKPRLNKEEIYNVTILIIERRKKDGKGPFQAMLIDYIRLLNYFPREELWLLVKERRIRAEPSLNSWCFFPQAPKCLEQDRVNIDSKILRITNDKLKF